MSSLKSRSFKALGWDLLGRIGSQGIGFFISIVLARILLPEDFGMLAMVNVVIVVANVFIEMGFGGVLIQRQDVSNVHYSSVYYLNLTVGILLSITLFFSSWSIGAFYNNQDLPLIVQAMSPVFLFNSLGNVLRTKLRKELNMKVITFTGWIGMLMSGGTGVAMALNGYGVWSLVASSLINPLISNLSLFLFVRWQPELVFDLKVIKELWKDSWKLLATGILDVFFGNLDSLLIGKIFMAKQLGFYYRATSLRSMTIDFGSGSLNNIIFPALSQIQSDKDALRRVVNNGYHALCFICFFLIALFYIVAEDLIIVLFTDKWLPSVEMFRILLLAAFVTPTGYIMQHVVTCRGKFKLYLQLNIVKKIILLSTYMAGIFMGFKAFLYCVVLGNMLAYIITIIYAAKELDENPIKYFSVLSSYILLALVPAGITNLAISQLEISNHFVNGLSLSLLFSLLYFGIGYLTKQKGALYILSHLSFMQKNRRVMI